MAGVLGVTQYQLENEFYMLDIAKFAEMKRQQDAIDRIHLINIVNSRHLEENDYKEMMQSYRRQANIKPKKQKFDRSKFEQLRALDM